MPASPQHEARHRVFKFDPGLFSRIAEQALGIKLPSAATLTELNVDLTETRPIERRADTILQTAFPDGGTGPILIIESQTEEDRTRRRRWPYYVAFVHDKYESPVQLIVVTASRATADWAREPIEIGVPGSACMILIPMVLGPDNVPAVTTLAGAMADLPLALLSVQVHTGSPEPIRDAIIKSLADALKTIDVTTAADYAEFTEVGLGDTKAAQKWRSLMATGTYEYASEQRSQGRVEGEAKSVLRNLKNRGIPVDPHSSDRINACTDVDTLDTWLDRSLTVTKVTELFSD